MTNEKLKGKTYGASQFPPFATLEIGDVVRGTISAARVLEKKEKDRKTKKEIVTYEPVLEITPSEEVELNFGSLQKGTLERREYAVGEKFSLSVSGNLYYVLADIIADIQGEKLPEGFEWSREILSCLEGLEVGIERIKDGKVAKGKYAGKARKMFTLTVN